MVFLLVTFVFLSEFLELLDDLIVFADLLIDGKQHGIERDYSAKHYPKNFSFHNDSPKVTREPKERVAGGPPSPPALFVRRLQARAGTPSAQVSTFARIASSEYE
ncbi:hypothetical protein, partial [Methanoregula sp.]|uniref:hypothetical protein n=1 Tax=Methanoregula sp. TaxID=2052170 RepID=UPI003C6ED4FB